jgi:hypothetical protein
MKYIKVEGHPNLYRDESTGAIVNFDDIGYNQYILNRQNKKKLKESQKNEIENLKNEVGEIKSLLMELLNESRRNRTE